MSNSRLTQVLLVIVGILLLANLVRPILAPGTAFADEDEPSSSVAITGSGNVAWVLKGNQVYYLKFETQFEDIRVYGPEDLER